jgi:hypothetical protein
MDKMSKNGLTNIKAGDRVWISAKWGGGEKGELKTVKRLTPTQIILEGQYEKYNRYQRGKPSRCRDEPTYYGIGMASGSITCIATKAECEWWDAEQERKRLAQVEAEAKRDADERKKQELNSLLPKKANVDGPYRNTWGEWRVTIMATETEVQEIAERLRGTLNPPPTTEE